jgi:hypothetical protein
LAIILVLGETGDGTGHENLPARARDGEGRDGAVSGPMGKCIFGTEMKAGIGDNTEETVSLYEYLSLTIRGDRKRIKTVAQSASQ